MYDFVMLTGYSKPVFFYPETWAIAFFCKYVKLTP
jgi:hypothetical protein